MFPTKKRRFAAAWWLIVMSGAKTGRSAATWLFIATTGCVLAASDARPAAPVVHDEVFVPSDGTQLYVEIKGAKKDAPVVLLLHEGPANPLGIMAFEAYPGIELEKSFIVAYLHQRGVLRSPDVPDSTQTLAHHLDDVDNVVEYLRKRFNKPRVHLIGHSWGGVLGYLYILEHGEKVGKCVVVAAPFNVAATQFASYETTLQWARDTNNQAAMTDLIGIGNPPYANHSELLTKTLWSAEAFGGLTTNIDADSVVKAVGYTEYDSQWGEEQQRINDVMFSEVQKINVEDRVGSVQTPLLLIAGRNDAEVPYFTLKRGFEKWGGKKTFVVFDKSNHIPFVDETDRFVKETRAFLLE